MKKRSWYIFSIIMLFTYCATHGMGQTENVMSWRPVGNFTITRSSSGQETLRHSTLLPEGKVLKECGKQIKVVKDKSKHQTERVWLINNCSNGFLRRTNQGKMLLHFVNEHKKIITFDFPTVFYSDFSKNKVFDVFLTKSNQIGFCTRQNEKKYIEKPFKCACNPNSKASKSKKREIYDVETLKTFKEKAIDPHNLPKKAKEMITKKKLWKTGALAMKMKKHLSEEKKKSNNNN